MKTDRATEAGIGFTLIVAAATLAVAVGAGLFLIWQSDAAWNPSAKFRAPPRSQLSLFDTPDVRRGPQLSDRPAPDPGIAPAPAVSSWAPNFLAGNPFPGAAPQP